MRNLFNRLGLGFLNSAPGTGEALAASVVFAAVAAPPVAALAVAATGLLTRAVYRNGKAALPS